MEDKLYLLSYNYSCQWRNGGWTILAVFPMGCTPIKGPLSQRQARQPNEKKNEESESFIYIRDILFILADRLGSLRALASNRF